MFSSFCSLTWLKLQVLHSCEQDGASHESLGSCPACMVFLKNILIDTTIMRDKSKQSSPETCVRGESSLCPQASLYWDCGLVIGDVWLISQPGRVHCKENIWECDMINCSVSPWWERWKNNWCGSLLKGHAKAFACFSPFTGNYVHTVCVR